MNNSFTRNIGYIQARLSHALNMEGSFPTDHLPFPMPSRKHSLSQEWRDLTFMHWAVDVAKLQPHIPDGLEIDTYDGKAYIGLVPFVMKNVRPRRLFSVPFISTFPEFNVRTYVKKDGIAGVYFLTLEAKSIITCNYATRAYGLPYNYANGRVIRNDSRVMWQSKRQSSEMALSGVTTIAGPTQQAEKGSIEEFLFERYSLYTSIDNRLMRGYTHHKPWRFSVAKVELKENSLTKSFDFGINDYLTPDIVHYSDGVVVNTYSIEIAERIGTDINRDFLFLDGDCGLCHRLATFMDKRMSPKANIGYRPNSSPDAQRVIMSLPKKFIAADTVYLIRNGKPYMKSSAAIRCLLYMKWYYRMLFPICWLIPLPARNFAYSIVARFRHKIFTRPKVCTFRVD